MIHFPEYGFAIISSIFWALSAPVLNIGIGRLSKHSDFLPHLFLGLILALFSGSIFLGAVLLASGNSFIASYNGYVLGAGIFTFPVATGLYYLSSHYLNNRTELASLFAKIKPLFSTLLAFVFIGEVIKQQSYLSIAFIMIGLLLFGLSTRHQRFTWKGITLGLLTACAWSVGEIFVTVGFNSDTVIVQTFYALTSASIISVFLWLLLMKTKKLNTPPLTAFIPFLWHGIFSFGVAYLCLFKSIATIGIVKSVIITAFWPMLSLILTGIINYIKEKDTKIELGIWIAATCFICASINQVLNT